MTNPGTLYGLGVGPGDPDLITLKAHAILQQVPVIAYPAPDTGDSIAREIASSHLPGHQEEIVIRTPMIPDAFPANDVYDHYAGEIRQHLEEGRDVAVLCEGDPFLYGSFMYVFSRFVDAGDVVVVPGVSSLGACAAVAGAPLVSRNQVLAVVPATLKEEELRRRVADSAALAIMKVGRHLAKVRRVLDELGRMNGAQYVERATMDTQKTMALEDVSNNKAPYFSMILVREPEGDV